METLFPQVLKVKSNLEVLVSNIDTSVAKQQRLAGLTNNLRRLLDELRIAFAQAVEKGELHATQRVAWERRLEKAQEDSKLLICTVEKAIGHIERTKAEDLERTSLLSTNARRRRTDTEALLAEERNRLDSSALILDSLIAQGKSTVSNLIQQKSYLKSASAKLNSSLVSLGVSSSLISAAQSRLRSDRFITYAGMAGVTVIIYVVYCWWVGIHVFWWVPTRLIAGTYHLIS